MKKVLGYLFISAISGVFLTAMIFLPALMVFDVDITGWKAAVIVGFYSDYLSQLNNRFGPQAPA